MLISAKTSTRQSSNDINYYNTRLCQSVPNNSLSARFYSDLQQLQYDKESPSANQYRSTMNSIELSRNLSSKQSCRTSMPCLNESLKKKNCFNGLRTLPCLIYMPGVKTNQPPEMQQQQKKDKKVLLTPHLKNPIKHISFEFRNKDKWNPIQKIN